MLALVLEIVQFLNFNGADKSEDKARKAVDGTKKPKGGLLIISLLMPGLLPKHMKKHFIPRSRGEVEDARINLKLLRRRIG